METTMSFIKGEKPRDLDAAKGGAKLGRSRDFLKESDGTDQTYNGNKPYDNPDGPLQDYGKDKKYGKAGAPSTTVEKGFGVVPVKPKRTGDKSLAAVTPRK